MPPHLLTDASEAAWLYVAAPLLAVTALALSARLRLPQLGRLGAMVTALRSRDPEADGVVAPFTAAALAAVGSYGAAAAIGAATAVSLGGAGAIPWIWVFGLLMAPLRVGETLLSRTDVAGKGHAEEVGALSARLIREPGLPRALGLVLIPLLAACAFAFVGGVHGGGLQDAAERVLPGSFEVLGLTVAALGIGLAALGPRRGGAMAGYLGVAALCVLLALASWAAMTDPGLAVVSVGRGMSEAFSGAPAVGAFVGAFASEVALASLTTMLPPLAATTGLAGALHGAAQARTSSGQAAAAMAGPFVYVLVSTVLCAAFVATGSFLDRTEGTRPLSDVRIYVGSFDTASQRVEPERLRNGPIRIVDGTMRDQGVSVATDRGIVRSPQFDHRGEPGDIALSLEAGRATHLLVRGEHESLRDAAEGELAHVTVRGEMLPRGGALLEQTVTSGTGSPLAGRLLLACLLVLTVVAVTAFGFATARLLGAWAPAWARVVLASLPGLGLAAGSLGLIPWLTPIGGLAAAAALSVTCLVLLLKAREVGQLMR